MFANLALGSLLIAITVLIQTFGLLAISSSMPHLIRRFGLHRHPLGQTVALVKTVFGLFLVHTVEVWAWAFLFLYIGAIGDFQDALAYSTNTFSTVGGADEVIASDWRLLGSLEGVDGFLLIGWSIAYLVGASTRYGPFRAGEHF